MTSENVFENLPEKLLCPPAHAWEGPQPGLYAQADEACRYYFSQKTGCLKSIVHYNSSGQPDRKYLYRVESGGSKKPYIFEIQSWNGAEFISNKILSQDGRTIASHSLPRIMLAEQGVEKPIASALGDVFITAAGEVVRLEQASGQPRAVYLGRVKGFDPLSPYKVRTLAGVQPIAVDRKDVIISPDGEVFEFSAAGLTFVGELVVPELDIEEEKKEEFNIGHDFFSIRIVPHENFVRMDIRDPHMREVVEGPVHKISGKHAFIHRSVPELVDVHGSLTAETNLRLVERHALELGLVFFAIKNESNPHNRAAFLKAEQVLEHALWTAIDAFEKSLGADRHTIINAQDIRSWIDFAATNPHEALLELKESAQKMYAA